MYISNLAKYINIFASCTINLFNYRNIDIPQTSAPIWTTRFTTVETCPDEPMLDGWRMDYKIFLLDPGLQNTTFPSCTDSDDLNSVPPPFRKNTGLQKAWNCLTRFYIFPPDKNLGILHPSNYEENFAKKTWHVLFDFDYEVPRVGYHIFVQNKSGKVNFAEIETLRVFFNRDGLNIFLLLVKEQHKIFQTMICCRYCYLYFKMCYPFGELGDVATMRQVEEGVTFFNKINSAANICVWGIPNNPKILRNPKLHEVGRNLGNVDYVLLHIVAQNTTLSCATDSPPTTEFCETLPNLVINTSSFVLHYGCYSTHSYPLINANSERDIILTRRIEQFGFLACSPRRQPQTSLAALLGVYKIEVWVSVLVTMTVASLFILFTTKEENYISTLFTTLSIGYTMLLEQGAGLDKNLKKQRSLYFIFGPWILMSLIITNSTRGDNVTNILAPLRVTPYENFSQLFHAKFKFMDRVELFWIASNDHVYMPGYGTALAKATWTVQTSGSVISWKVLDRLRKYNVVSLIDQKQNYRNLWRHHEVFLQNGTLTEFHCAGDLLAFLGWMKYLQVAKAFLEDNHPGPEYSLGKEFIAEQSFGWKMERVVDPRIMMRVRGLITSGISGRWIFYEQMGKSRNFSPSAIYRAPIAAAGIAFLCERMYNGVKSLRQYGIRKAFLGLILQVNKRVRHIRFFRAPPKSRFPDFSSMSFVILVETFETHEQL
ncbi:hypothetical protein Fcan01_16181 [Folsomia candida]|uniref:Uncharacterized protein n=1 Tax=Folsomia candida TaxID=158441 RepID=A0A226DU90_FOLCA|nr:hypothetical protein Fcan01_16181 [Folsomia candida]